MFRGASSTSTLSGALRISTKPIRPERAALLKAVFDCILGFRGTVLTFELNGAENRLGTQMVFRIPPKAIGPKGAAFNRTQYNLGWQLTATIPTLVSDCRQGRQNLRRIDSIPRPGVAVFISHDSFLLSSPGDFQDQSFFQKSPLSPFPCLGEEDALANMVQGLRLYMILKGGPLEVSPFPIPLSPS
jgi:hypothetical protein